MWPEDRKDASSYAATLVIDDLWSQFREALGRARRVFVLGHSLHDPFLVDALRSVPPDRLAVGIYGKDPQEMAAANAATLRVVEESFGSMVTVLPIVFGTEPSSVEAIRKWQQGTTGVS